MNVLELIVSSLAVGGHLLVGIAAALRWGRSSVAVPLALLGLLLSTWTAASLAHEFLPDPQPGPFRGWWHYVDVAISPLLPALTLAVVITFTGGRIKSSERGLLAASVVLSTASGMAGFFEPFRAFEASIYWELVYLSLSNPLILFGLLRLRGYLAGMVGDSEARRAHLLASSLVVGWTFALTEILHDLWPGIPRLGPVGLLVSSVMLAAAVLRFDLVGRRAWFLFAGLPMVAVAFSLGFSSFGGRQPNPLLVVLFPSVAIGLAVAWPIWRIQLVRARRRQQLVILGRLVAQMTHDLKNPIASIQGAAQFLLVELDAGKPLTEHRWFLEQITDNARRMGATIDVYRRLGTLELDRQRTSIDALVEKAAGCVPSGYAIELRLSPGVVRVDRDLVVAAVENIVVNAVQAAGPAGQVLVGCAGGEEVQIWVEDSGAGLPARERSQVLRDFFTTKPGGTGLGLPFVRRVAEAHEGHISLEDGQTLSGLRVVLSFPPADATSRSLPGPS